MFTTRIVETGTKVTCACAESSVPFTVAVMFWQPLITGAKTSYLIVCSALATRPAAEEVPVLGDGSGEDCEVDLSVVVDCDDADNGSRCGVSSEEHDSGLYPFGVSGVGEYGPAVSVVVHRVEVGDEVEVVVHVQPPLVVRRDDTGCRPFDVRRT